KAISVADGGGKDEHRIFRRATELDNHLFASLQRRREYGCKPQFADIDYATRINRLFAFQRGLQLQALIKRIARAAPAVFLPVAIALPCRLEGFEGCHHADL